MDIEAEIARVIDEHSHIYDSDCGMDFGCECGSIDDYDNSTTTHAQHLAEVLSPLLNCVRAEALREAADEIEMKRNEPGLVKLGVQYAGYYTGIRSGMESAVRAIRSRIEQNSEGNET